MSLSRRSLLSTVVYGGLSAGFRPLANAETLASPSKFVLRSRPAKGRREPPVVTCLAIQSGGDLIAVGGDDHLLRVWNFRSGKLVHELAGHRDWIRAVLFVPARADTGHTEIITAGNDRRLLQWTIAEGGVAHRQLAQHEQVIAALAASPNGKHLVATGFEPRMCLYDLATGKHVAHLACPCQDMRAVTFSPDGETLAAAGRNGRIRMWAVEDRKHVRDIEAHRQRIRALAFSPDGRHLASASEDRTTRIWDMTTGKSVKSLSTGTAKILSATYLDDDHLATGGSDNVIRIWEVDSQLQVDAFTGHTGSVATLVHDQNTLISGSFDTTVRIWQPLLRTQGADRRFDAGSELK